MPLGAVEQLSLKFRDFDETRGASFKEQMSSCLTLSSPSLFGIGFVLRALPPIRLKGYWVSVEVGAAFSARRLNALPGDHVEMGLNEIFRLNM